MIKVFEIMRCIVVQPSVTEDELIDALIELV